MATSKQCSRLVPSRLLVGKRSAQGNVGREEDAQRIMGVLFWTHNSLRSLLFLSKRLGESLGVPWAWDRAEKGEKAHRFGQLYEINVAPPSKRPPLEFPFRLALPWSFRPSKRPLPLEKEVRKTPPRPPSSL